MKKLVYLLSLIIPLCFSLEARERSVLKMGHVEFSPAYYTDSNGKSTGRIIDLAEEIAKEAGFELVAESFPAKRIIRYLRNGKIDVWLGLRTLKGFEEYTHMGTTKLNWSLRLVLFSKIPVKKVTSVKDLKGKKVILLRGYSYGGLTKQIKDPKNGVSYYDTKSHVSALKMLRDNRADILLDYDETSKVALEKVKIDNLHRQVIHDLPCYIVVSKKTPNGADILQKLEKAFIRITDRASNNL